MSDEKPPPKLTVLTVNKPKKPDAAVIEMLECLLEKAKKGELRSVMVMGHYDSIYGHDHAGLDSIQEVMSYMAMCDVSKQTLLGILEANTE